MLFILSSYRIPSTTRGVLYVTVMIQSMVSDLGFVNLFGDGGLESSIRIKIAADAHSCFVTCVGSCSVL